MGAVFGSKSMVNSISLSRGIHGSSSGKTSTNSRTIGISSILHPNFSSVTQAKYLEHPLLNNLVAYIADINLSAPVFRSP
jgi:hypothetical protein